MNTLRFRLPLLATLAVSFSLGTSAHAGESFATTAADVNKKMVKLFGSGGFQGLASYGTGAIISPEGHILTVASHLLDTQDLRVHTYDGRRFHAKVIVVEPELDAALVKIDDDKLDDLPYFDVAKAAQAPVGRNGDWILAFSNQFQIATRDEPMSVQRGVIAAYTKLEARKGVHDAPYQGDVYVIDAITNNPGAGGGVVTSRKGEFLGIIGKELRNTRSETWVNYAVPIQVLANFVDKAKKGQYTVIKREKTGGIGGYHGIALVANAVLERTPPFIEEVAPDSPAAKAGLKADDLIVYVDGDPVVNIESFRKIIDRVRPGTVVKLDVRRSDKSVPGSGDKLITIDLKLEEPLVKTVPPKK